eukprot:c16357_g2_i2.p1 GENE.c16357_g2_i2~~c16357_g2_i2.p1  ORF type:complete len:190 (+),score=56.60 c16357_g2_i2:63-632(+)
MDQPIPSPWIQYYDELQGRNFYYNPITKESQWTLPADPLENKPLLTPIEPVARSVSESTLSNSESIMSRIWEKHFDANTGQYYYYNTITQKTQWNAPPELSIPTSVIKLPEQTISPEIAQVELYEEFTDPATNKSYYVNIKTRRTCWELPEGAFLKAQPKTTTTTSITTIIIVIRNKTTTPPTKIRFSN